MLCELNVKKRSRRIGSNTLDDNQVSFDPSGRHNRPSGSENPGPQYSGSQRPGPRGVPKIFMLAFVFCCAMLFMQFIRGGSGIGGASGTPGDPSNSNTVPVPDYASRRAKAQNANDKAQSGDWSIEDVDVDNSRQSDFSTSAKATGDSATSGDWSIEDVDTTKPANNSRSTSKPQPSTTRKGDWEISE